MRFEKIWVKQCRATKEIRRRFGAKSALDYLVREKLIMFANEAERHPSSPRNCRDSWLASGRCSISTSLPDMSRASGSKAAAQVAVHGVTRRDAYSKSGRSSRGISRRIDRPCPGTRSMKPFDSSVSTI